MHVNEVSIVSIDLHHLLLVISIDVDVIANFDMLMWKNHTWFAELVAWSSVIVNLQISSLLVLINLEEEVLLCDDFLVCLCSKLLLAHLVFELDKVDLLLNNCVDSLLNGSDMR